MRFRRATDEDLEKLIDIHFAAYPDVRTFEARERNFTHNPFGTVRHLMLLEEGEELLAHAFLFPLRASFGGRQVRMGGIASVAVAPAHRGRGLGTKLVEHLHALSD